MYSGSNFLSCIPSQKIGDDAYSKFAYKHYGIGFELCTKMREIFRFPYHEVANDLFDHFIKDLQENHVHKYICFAIRTFYCYFLFK